MHTCLFKQTTPPPVQLDGTMPESKENREAEEKFNALEKELDGLEKERKRTLKLIEQV